MARCPTLSLLLLFALASGCASPPPHAEEMHSAAAPAPRQQRPAMQGLLADQLRLFRVGYPLLRAARDLCKEDTRYAPGLFAVNRYTLGNLANFAPAYGIGDEVTLLAVVPDGPAHKAGLASGDVVVSVNGESSPTDAQSTGQFMGKMADLNRAGQPLEFTVRRGEATLKATVHPEPICSYSVQPYEETRVNATADGKRRIIVSLGMMKFAATDPELALVVAHEIAHNALGHYDAVQRLLSSAPARSGISASSSQAFETEADYVGLYLMARAGMPIGNIPRFLERNAAFIGDDHAATHPSNSARLAAVRKTVDEIERKRAAGLPLSPDLRTRQ
jgi:hypothetical protein